MIKIREKVQVQNRTGHAYSGSDFLNNWEDEKGHAATKCARIGCGGSPTCGGHVYKVGDGPHPCYYIVPLCSSCNQKQFPDGYYVYQEDMVEAEHQD